MFADSVFHLLCWVAVLVPVLPEHLPPPKEHREGQLRVRPGPGGGQAGRGGFPLPLRLAGTFIRYAFLHARTVDTRTVNARAIDERTTNARTV